MVFERTIDGLDGTQRTDVSQNIRRVRIILGALRIVGDAVAAFGRAVNYGWTLCLSFLYGSETFEIE